MRNGEIKKAWKICVESLVKIPIVRPSCEWKYNINGGLKQVGWVGVYWIYAA